MCHYAKFLCAWYKTSLARTPQVAKCYKKEGVRGGVYYNDLLVQMDAKMLGEMYNKTDPPKQVKGYGIMLP